MKKLIFFTLFISASAIPNTFTSMNNNNNSLRKRCHDDINRDYDEEKQAQKKRHIEQTSLSTNSSSLPNSHFTHIERAQQKIQQQNVDNKNLFYDQTRYNPNYEQPAEQPLVFSTFSQVPPDEVHKVCNPLAIINGRKVVTIWPQMNCTETHEYLRKEQLKKDTALFIPSVKTYLSGIINLLNARQIDQHYQNTATFLMHIGEQMTSLRIPSDCNDRLLGMICTFCPNLISLTLIGCDKITDNGLLMIHCKKLTRLNLNGCANVGDVGVIHLLKQNPQLEYIHLYDTAISNRTVQVIQKLLTVSYIDITECQNITRNGVAILRQFKPNLGIDSDYVYEQNNNDDEESIDEEN